MSPTFSEKIEDDALDESASNLQLSHQLFPEFFSREQLKNEAFYTTTTNMIGFQPVDFILHNLAR
jgi:hypothetical protein